MNKYIIDVYNRCIYRNYREDCLTYFNNIKEAQKYEKYIIAIETELTRRGVDFK